MAAMDGLTLAAVTAELQALTGGRIDKIAQPERDELLLFIRAGGANYKLLLCTSADQCRVQFTQNAPANPPEPPMFCMLLRKRLTGARILEIIQPNLDRVLNLKMEARNDLGDLEQHTLVIEIMGKHSNIILLNERGTIVDAIRHVGADMSSVRMVLPGAAYVPPPAQQKQDPRVAREEDFILTLEGIGMPQKRLSQAFSGLAPSMAAALCAKALGQEPEDLSTMQPQDKKALAAWLFDFYCRVAKGMFSPSLVFDGQQAAAFYPFEPWCPEENLRRYSSMSQALEEYYASRAQIERLKRRSASLMRILQNNIERCEKKAALHRDILHSGDRMEEYRRYGDLIIANLHSIKKGCREAVVEDYYSDPIQKCIVPMEESLAPADNAQRYYKKYQKLRAGRELAASMLQETEEELQYLLGQLDNLGKCTAEAELAELRAEMVEQGYVKPEQKRGNKPPKLAPSQPMRFLSSDGIEIYVGKNNRQNDALTLRFATGGNYWLHTKEIPGSHVIIRMEGEPPENTLREAAMLAAFYSSARGSAQVPVDYTPRKYVKKPAGAKPGMVIYSTNRTLYITPDESAVMTLKRL